MTASPRAPGRGAGGARLPEGTRSVSPVRGRRSHRLQPPAEMMLSSSLGFQGCPEHLGVLLPGEDTQPRLRASLWLQPTLLKGSPSASCSASRGRTGQGVRKKLEVSLAEVVTAG